jgi:hypothetical protein
VFGSSVEVMISVWGEDPAAGIPFHCGDAFATVVAVDASGDPVLLDCDLEACSSEDSVRQAGAGKRREGRLALRQHLKVRSARPSLDEEVRWSSGEYRGEGDEEFTM